MPCYPSLEPAFTPRPPKLSPGFTPEEKVKALLTAYRGAVESRFHVRSWASRAGDKLRPILEDAAELLEEYDIAPAAWAAFSCDAWKEHAPSNLGSKPPAVKWVFSPKRLMEKHNWFKSDSLTYTVSRVVYGDKSKALMSRYKQMEYALQRLEDVSEPRIRAVVAEFFPGDSLKQQIAEARAENAEIRSRLLAQAKRGDWFWGSNLSA